jgi:hypothetical protein
MEAGTDLRVEVATCREGYLRGEELGEFVVRERTLRTTLDGNEVVGIVILYTLCLGGGGHSEKERHCCEDIINLFHNTLFMFLTTNFTNFTNFLIGQPRENSFN